MARSIDPQPKAARGFIPARTDEERYLMRHIEDLAHTAFSRDIARYSAFLSDREQDLARAALGRAGVQEGFRFEGGWLNAERRVLCIEPEYSCGEAPICCVRLQCRAQAGAALPAHKDYLGSLMGLELRREALGDIVLPEDQPGTAYVFALEPAAQLICRELFQAGHTELAPCRCGCGPKTGSGAALQTALRRPLRKKPSTLSKMPPMMDAPIMAP